MHGNRWRLTLHNGDMLDWVNNIRLFAVLSAIVGLALPT
jgi:hypothetical protein